MWEQTQQSIFIAVHVPTGDRPGPFKKGSIVPILVFPLAWKEIQLIMMRLCRLRGPRA